MPTYVPILTKSPFFVSEAGTAGEEIKVELYLWNDPASEPSNPTKTLTKPIPSTLITQADFDISPHVREFIDHATYGTISADTAAAVGEYAFCTVRTYKDDILQNTLYYIGFDGYGYFADGYNPNYLAGFLDGGTYNTTETETGSVFYYDDQTVTWEAKYTGLTTGGVTTVTLANRVGHVPYIHPTYVGEGNTLEIIRDGVPKSTYTFKEVCENKYTPVNCDFVNKYGTWQRLVFFKASKRSMTMQTNEHNLMPDSINYDGNKNVRQTFNTNGNEKITVNTGWVDEGYSEVIKQLLLSDKVLLDRSPVNVATKDVVLQESINDRNINYQINFNYANEVRNYII